MTTDEEVFSWLSLAVPVTFGAWLIYGLISRWLLNKRLTFDQHRERAEKFFDSKHGDTIDFVSIATEHPEFIARVVELEARRRNARPREEQEAADRMLRWLLKLLDVERNERAREKLLLRPDLVQQLAAFEKALGDKRPYDYEATQRVRGGNPIPVPEHPRLFIEPYTSSFAPLRADASEPAPVEATLTEK